MLIHCPPLNGTRFVMKAEQRELPGVCLAAETSGTDTGRLAPYRYNEHYHADAATTGFPVRSTTVTSSDGMAPIACLGIRHTIFTRLAASSV